MVYVLFLTLFLGPLKNLGHPARFVARVPTCRRIASWDSVGLFCKGHRKSIPIFLHLSSEYTSVVPRGKEHISDLSRDIFNSANVKHLPYASCIRETKFSKSHL